MILVLWPWKRLKVVDAISNHKTNHFSFVLPIRLRDNSKCVEYFLAHSQTERPLCNTQLNLSMLIFHTNKILLSLLLALTVLLLVLCQFFHFSLMFDFV